MMAQTSMSVRAGFSVASLERAVRQPKRTIGGALRAHCLALRDDAAEALLFSFDLMVLSRSASSRLRREIGRRTKLEPSRIVTTVTQTHSAPLEDGIDLDALAELCADLAGKARAQSEPVTISHSQAGSGNGLSVYRRKVLDPRLGAWTVWGGFGPGNDATEPTHRRSGRWGKWIADEIAPEGRTILYDAPVDDRVQLAVFWNAAGKATGSLLRFAAHPVIGCHYGVDAHGPDFPGPARDRVERQLSAPCLFLNGPCGDLTIRQQARWEIPAVADPRECGPEVPRASGGADAWEREAERAGHAIADLALRETPDPRHARAPRSLQFVPQRIELPFRADLARTAGDAKRLAGQHRDKFLASCERKGDLAEIKRHADLWKFHGSRESFRDTFHFFDEAELAAGNAAVEFVAVGLGELLLLGLPGETMRDTGKALEAAAAERGFTPLTFSEANGETGYIPTPGMWDEGDYEVYFSVLGRDAEPALRGHFASRLRRMGR